MKMIDQLKDESLGCAILYNFTKGYGNHVPVQVYDFVLPLIYNEVFSKHILKSDSYKVCVEKSLQEFPALFSNLQQDKQMWSDLVSRTCGMMVVQQMLTFEVENNTVCGSCMPSQILEFNEAIRLGQWFKELALEEIEMSFSHTSLNIVILDGDNLGKDIDLSLFHPLGQVTIYGMSSYEEALNRVQEADVILTNKVNLDKHLINNASQLKYIGLFATGTNNVDMEYCHEKGIVVKNVANYSTDIVAQHTFALLFYLYNKMNHYDQYVKSGEYCHSPMFTHYGLPFNELSGKTWGIVGLGNIGRKVASIASAFGCQVVYYSTSQTKRKEDYKSVDFETLLKECDVISVHAPLNEHTHHLFNARAFAHMKRTAYFINVGRGPIVNEEDLAFALKHQLIAGAGLDVLNVEPMEKDNPLLPLCDSTSLVITPHIAWASVEARNRLVKWSYQNLVEFMKENN